MPKKRSRNERKSIRSRARIYVGKNQRLNQINGPHRVKPVPIINNELMNEKEGIRSRRKNGKSHKIGQLRQIKKAKKECRVMQVQK